MSDSQLSIPSKAVLLDELFKGVASGLGESLVPFAGNLLVSLFQKLKEDQLYQQTIMAYKQQELQAIQEFSKQLLDLLGEWQKDANEQKREEIQTLWDKDNWFSKLDRHETESILAQKQHRLLILASIPAISPDCPPSFHHNLEIEIRNGTTRFLREYYPLGAPNCPVEFYGDYFKESISALDVKRLQGVLGSVPTAVLYSDITDYQVNFQLGFWGLPNTSVVQYLLPPWNWEDACRILIKEGQDKTQALRKIRQIIVAVHWLLAAFIADWYYLNINPFYEPQLFQLESVFPSVWTNPFIEVLQKIYRLNQSGLYYERGLALFKLKRYSCALASFDKAIELKIDYPEALFYRELVSCCSKEKGRCQNCCKSQTLSARGVDYTQLRDFLAAGEWSKADLETGKVMCQAAGKESEGWLDVQDIDNFPCEDLRTINQLWLHYTIIGF